MPLNSARGGSERKIAAIGAETIAKSAVLARTCPTAAELAESSTGLVPARRDRHVRRLREHVRIPPAIMARLHDLDGEERPRATSLDGSGPRTAAPVSRHGRPVAGVGEALPEDVNGGAGRRIGLQDGGHRPD